MKKIFSIFICTALLLTVGFGMILCDFSLKKGQIKIIDFWSTRL